MFKVWNAAHSRMEALSVMNTKVIAEEGDAATVRLDPVDFSLNRNVETPVCCFVVC